MESRAALFPYCKLVTFDGDPGLGKSTALLDRASQVSSHSRVQLFEQPHEPGLLKMMVRT
jgi:hypothetical protein